MLDSSQRHNLKSLIIVPKLKTWLRKIWQNNEPSFELACLEDPWNAHHMLYSRNQGNIAFSI
jgi:hypothetical protein